MKAIKTMKDMEVDDQCMETRLKETALYQRAVFELLNLFRGRRRLAGFHNG